MSQPQDFESIREGVFTEKAECCEGFASACRKDQYTSRIWFRMAFIPFCYLLYSLLLVRSGFPEGFFPSISFPGVSQIIFAIELPVVQLLHFNTLNYWAKLYSFINVCVSLPLETCDNAA